MKTEFVNFPGGGVDLGEAPSEALRREFLEETGLTPEPVRILHSSMGAHISTQKPWQLVSAYWLIEAEGEPKMGGNGDDVVSLFWADEGDIPTAEMFPTEREFVERLPALLKGPGTSAA